ncbi:threonine ammonia-lyase [Caldibacillus thermolactis]|jgi:threonine dehydratase|uniref:Threonine ammonia-lyase n=1 Tax=Pallidibacillus thermolactis TaxID=251051 RepID=A0ABT2WFM0_9BACI|nr:threonine ammonia-lyase [Pallidibacillus thermolactis]MCU9594488.1 threonine ammonia-lyase [Pallidibacillus thermolactis]MCU9600959.1 threonine ammonia-lyase [Pallidibacillus thermolactis subsp. kokeshiiformis]MED1674777.1 threonine ammonia-lyase [Pallidibacillus thermolactis subsp. kokeshiiformis]
MKAEEVTIARERMKGNVHVTPLDYSKTFSDISDNDVYLKLENMQKTGSFKVRGAYNKVFSLSDEELKKGVIAASAGNHAQGVAYASQKLNVPCTIVMPEGAPISKVQATLGYGAKVVQQGKYFDEALAHAIHLQKETDATFIHAFDDEAIIAGQGTVGLEILEQLPDVDAIVVPIGGGGLIAGIALAVKEKNPHIKIYGVEAKACPSMKRSLESQQPEIVETTPTMADGIAVAKPGLITYEIVQRYVDDIFLVDEMEIARTMLMLLERNKLMVEGSGATSLASLLYKKIPLKNKKVVSVLSGGNVDMNFISRIIERGLVESGRFATFSIIIKDKPGALQNLLAHISKLDANIKTINQNHVGIDIFPGFAKIIVTLETKNQEHIELIQKTLINKGYEVNLNPY